jgi:hypothetical protein
LALAIDIVRAPAGVDPHIAVAPAQLLQDLPERRYAGLTLWIVRGHVHQHADPPHPLGLRSRRERPSGCTANEHDELAPPHSITSSASASSALGILAPVRRVQTFVLAALVLTTMMLAVVLGGALGVWLGG